MRPDAIRVGRRALTLDAVSVRAAFESTTPAETAAEYRASLLDWVAARQLDGELEPHARQFLAAPSWTTEGAAVLAWSLGRLTLPPVDRLVTRDEVGDALYDELPWADLRLRTAGEIDLYEAVLYNLNWRVNHHRWNPNPYDLRAMLRDYDRLPVDAGPLAYGTDGDLMVDGMPFTAAAAERRATCTGIVLERRRAATWLCGDDPVYSSTSMDT